jgi:hypothetical protein
MCGSNVEARDEHREDRYDKRQYGDYLVRWDWGHSILSSQGRPCRVTGRVFSLGRPSAVNLITRLNAVGVMDYATRQASP